MSKSKIVNDAKQRATVKLMLANDSMSELIIPIIRRMKSSKYQDTRESGESLEVALMSINAALEEYRKLVDMYDSENDALVIAYTDQNEFLVDTIKSEAEIQAWLDRVIRPLLKKTGGLAA